MEFVKSLKLNGLLSFSTDSEAIPLTGLNVLIGPNGSGKSNVIEALELLRSISTGFANAIRVGGGAREWLWKGEPVATQASIEAVIGGVTPIPDLRYRLDFAPAGQRVEVLDEVIEEPKKRTANAKDVFFYYRFQQGHPVLNYRTVQKTTGGSPWVRRNLLRQDLAPDESILKQRRDRDLYPEVTWLGQQFGAIQTFREWSFGRYAPVRQPQSADLPTDVLLPDARNLGLLLNAIEHTGTAIDFRDLLVRFLPGYDRFSTLVQGGTVQFFLHEKNLRMPIPATRLSDGTIRYLALLAILLSPSPPPLLCIEEPELGLHPDAVRIIAELLVEASERTQLIVTTH